MGREGSRIQRGGWIRGSKIDWIISISVPQHSRMTDYSLPYIL
jgi:hypothetical protein